MRCGVYEASCFTNRETRKLLLLFFFPLIVLNAALLSAQVGSESRNCCLQLRTRQNLTMPFVALCCRNVVLPRVASAVRSKHCESQFIHFKMLENTSQWKNAATF